MKFVDEFREPELIRKTAREIAALADPSRHYRLMEVCGGHTHAIYRFGLKDLLPPNIELIHGPGCPVCVLPMGRIDDGLAMAERSDVTLTAFGDMMRVPGTKGSPLHRKAQGMDVRIVYSPMDALKVALGNPDKHVIFFAIGFETTAPSTAFTLKRARALGVRNFSVFCNHVTIIPAIRAILDSPDMRLDGFIGPGHVSTVIGCRPYEWIARNERKPIVVSGFERLDILQGILMVLRQLRDGEAKVENQYRRVVPWDGNIPALRAMADVFQLRPFFEWRGMGFISQSALRLRDEFADWDAEVRFDAPGIRVTDPMAAQCGEVLKGVLTPAQCKLFGNECTPEHPIGALMVSSEGSCAAYFNYEHRKLACSGAIAQRPNPMTTTAAPPSSKVRFKDVQIEMAHGAGGTASRRLVEGLIVPLLGGHETRRRTLDDAAWVPINGQNVAVTTDSFVVRPLQFPGGSIGELAVNGTVNDLAVSGARAIALVTTFVLEAGLPTAVLEAEVRAMADAAARAGVVIVGGDTKVVEHGKADGLYISTTGIGSPIPGATLDAQLVRPGDRVIVSGPIGDHGITILLARGDLALEADLRSDTRSVLPLVEAIVAAAGPGVRWMRDPTRGGVATSLNELARDAGVCIEVSEEAVPVNDAVRGACELLGLDPLHIANEGQCLAIVAAELAEAALQAMHATPGGEQARIIGVVRDQPAGVVMTTTGYGATRIVDMLVGDPLPPDLLMADAFSAAAPASSDLARTIHDAMMARNEIARRFFAREALPLAVACRDMSERFLRGGRLLAFGRGPLVTDAQHVAVEFVHPVIVGKRALPALDLSLDFRAWVPAILRSEDIVMGFAPPDGDADVQSILDAADARGAMTFALPGRHGSYAVDPPSPDAFIHQEIIEILYHTLWESVHVFFEHRELGHDVGEAGFLYPFLGNTKQDISGVVDHVAASIMLKVEDDAALRTMAATEQSDAIAAAVRVIHSQLQGGGKLILFGNGGSATDATDWALDCVHPPEGYRPVPAISLSVEPATITAISNDVGLEVSFLRQLIAHASPGDVAVAVSTSGGSKNVIAALEEARRRGLVTIGLLGYDGGDIVRRGLVDASVVVRSDYIPRIQEVQASIYHVMRDAEEALTRAEG